VQLFVHDLDGGTAFHSVFPEGAFRAFSEAKLAPTDERLLVSGEQSDPIRFEVGVVELPAAGSEVRFRKVTLPVDVATTQAQGFRSVWTGDGMHVVYVMLREKADGLLSEAVFATKVTPKIEVARNISGTNTIAFSMSRRTATTANASALPRSLSRPFTRDVARERDVAHTRQLTRDLSKTSPFAFPTK
jgi:hypothetical protein